MANKAIILGCGPAGLLAAHAAEMAGWEYVIWSEHKKSRIGGAQFLHSAIPDLTSPTPDATVRFQHDGDAAGYARKVYGNGYAPTSWGEYNGDQAVWNMRVAYDRLWQKQECMIDDKKVRPDDVRGAMEDGSVVISTIPRPAICKDPTHLFSFQQVWFTYEHIPHLEKSLNFVVYNGRPETRWYRFSQLFGWLSKEWSDEQAAVAESEGRKLISVQKPTDHNCNCWMSWAQFQPMGRYGRWKKGELIHHAFWKTVETLAQLEHGGNLRVV
jgi:hypothetical protein